MTVKVPEAAQLPAWIERRMRAASLQPSSDAVALIAERVEGNLLAAEQEIERLSLLHPGAEIDTEQVLSAVADSARFSIPAFVDAAMQVGRHGHTFARVICLEISTEARVFGFC